MKIYTKTGDKGQTGLVGGARVYKDDPRIAVIGDVDELNSSLGLARCEAFGTDIDGWLGRIQHSLFDLGAELATPDGTRYDNAWVDEDLVLWLEGLIDQQSEKLEPLRNFLFSPVARVWPPISITPVAFAGGRSEI